MIETIALLLVLIVELQVARCGGIFEEQAGSGVVGENLEDPLVALLGIDELVAILVEDAEIHEDPNRRRIALHGPLVAGLGLVIIADTVVDDPHREQRGGMSRIEGESLLKGRHCVSQREAEVSGNRGLLGPEISGGFGASAEL